MNAAPPRKSREELCGVRPWDIIRATTSPAFPGGPCERLIFAALWRHADFDGACWPSQRRLAAVTGFSTRRVRDGLTRLRAAQLVAWSAVFGRSHTFRLNAEATLALAAAGESAKPRHALPGSNEQVGDEETPEPRQDLPWSCDLSDAKDAPTPPTPAPGAGTPAESAAHPGRICRTPRQRVPTEVAQEVAHRSDPKKLDAAASAALRVTGATDHNANDDSGDNHNNASPGMRDNGGPTIAQVADRIAAATARLGGGHAKKGRAIAETFAKEGLATVATHELDELAKTAGMPRDSFAEIRAAIFSSAARDQT